MFEISVESSFSAAHHLKEYDGPCENIHGHNWRVVAKVRCEDVDSIGIGIDFKILKQTLKDILEQFDHTDINVFFEPQKINPSSENIAKYIFSMLRQRLTAYPCKVYKIEVYETPGNCASYFEHVTDS